MRLSIPKNIVIKSWGFRQHFFYTFVKLVLPRFFRIYFRFNVKNIEYIKDYPEGTPVIYSFNHRSHLDSFIFASALVHPYGNRTACGLMSNGDAMESNCLLSYLKYVAAYPVYPKNPTPALRYTIRLLKEDLAVLIAPQGKRIPSTPLDDYHNLVNTGKSGVGRIVLLLNGKIPVIPMYIKGSHEALSFGNIIPKIKAYLSLSLCKPLIFKEYTRKEGWKASDPDFYSTANKISKKVMQSIRDEMLVVEKYFLQIIKDKFNKPLEELHIDHKSHPEIYHVFRNLLQYTPDELKQWINSNQ